MKKAKKVLSLLLCMLMLVSVMPQAVFADALTLTLTTDTIYVPEGSGNIASVKATLAGASDAVYSLDNTYDGITVNSSTGVVTVEKGAYIGSVTVNAVSSAGNGSATFTTKSAVTVNADGSVSGDATTAGNKALYVMDNGFIRGYANDTDHSTPSSVVINLTDKITSGAYVVEGTVCADKTIWTNQKPYCKWVRLRKEKLGAEWDGNPQIGYLPTPYDTEHKFKIYADVNNGVYAIWADGVLKDSKVLTEDTVDAKSLEFSTICFGLDMKDIKIYSSVPMEFDETYSDGRIVTDKLTFSAAKAYPPQSGSYVINKATAPNGKAAYYTLLDDYKGISINSSTGDITASSDAYIGTVYVQGFTEDGTSYVSKFNTLSVAYDVFLPENSSAIKQMQFDGDITSYKLGGTYDGISIDESTGVITFAKGCYTGAVSVTATDSDGNTYTKSFNVYAYNTVGIKDGVAYGGSNWGTSKTDDNWLIQNKEDGYSRLNISGTYNIGGKYAVEAKVKYPTVTSKYAGQFIIFYGTNWGGANAGAVPNDGKEHDIKIIVDDVNKTYTAITDNEITALNKSFTKDGDKVIRLQYCTDLKSAVIRNLSCESAPVADAIMTDAEVGKTVRGYYDYYQEADCAEGGSAIKYEISDDGASYTELADGYIPSSADAGKGIRMKVTPVSANGVSGAPVYSDPITVKDSKAFEIKALVSTDGSEHTPDINSVSDIKSVKIEKNFDTESDHVVLYTALYTSNELVALEVADITSIPTGSNTVDLSGTVTVPENKEAYSVKVMIMDETGKPLSKYKSFKYLKTTKINIIGDSIVQTYSDGSVNQGWGKTLENYTARSSSSNADPDAIVHFYNMARGGWTTDTYFADEDTVGNYKASLWKNVKEQIEPEEYVIVSLGTNDAGSGNVSDEKYAANLKTFIDDSRAKGAEVLFVSPTTNGKAWNNTDPWGMTTIGKKAQVMKRVAEENNVVYIDLFTYMTNWANKRVADNMASGMTKVDAYNEVRGKIHKYVALGQVTDKDDTTHLNPNGADLVASFIAELIKESGSSLADYIK